MECPRCGADMETYSMWGREARTCGECNYVGVPVEHQSDREDPESWNDAIRRFREKHLRDQSDGEESGDGPTGEGATDDDGDQAPEEPATDADPDEGDPDDDRAVADDDPPEGESDDEPEVAADGASESSHG